MTVPKFHLIGHTAAIIYAAATLHDAGYPLLPYPDPEATHLILPVPSFEPDGSVRGGGDILQILALLPKDITIIGGNLDRPELALYRKIDLLKDPYYTAANAGITAHCAVKLAMNKLPATFDGQPVLVIGWGRIGKCLARLLQGMGAHVTVAARKETDRALLSALGYGAVDTEAIDTSHYRVVFNTVPVMTVPFCSGNALKIDRASKPGIGGTDVIWARGLPGKDAPESSGELIAKTIIRLMEE